MTGIIDGSGSVGAAMTQYIVAIVSDISLEIVFAILSLLLIGSAALIAPLCIRDVQDWYQNYCNVATEIDSPGGRGRFMKQDKDELDVLSDYEDRNQQVEIQKIIK